MWQVHGVYISTILLVSKKKTLKNEKTKKKKKLTNGPNNAFMDSAFPKASSRYIVTENIC